MAATLQGGVEERSESMELQGYRPVNALLNKFHAVEFFSRVNEDAGAGATAPAVRDSAPGRHQATPRAAVNEGRRPAVHILTM